LPIKRASTSSETLALPLKLSATKLPEPEAATPPLLIEGAVDFQ
jgi:hypothetical protein